MQTGKSRQTVTTYLSSAVMQSRWKNAGYLQSAAADLHQPHHLIMKRKRQPTAISREEIMIYLKVQSPNRQYTTYNYPEWLGLMLLNALSTQELLSTQFIIVLWSICCTYSFWGKKKNHLGNKHGIRYLWRKHWEWEHQFKKAKGLTPN